jgi:hypothetical protein
MVSDFVTCIATITTAENEDQDKEKVGFIATRLRTSCPKCSIHSDSGS